MVLIGLAAGPEISAGQTGGLLRLEAQARYDAAEARLEVAQQALEAVRQRWEEALDRGDGVDPSGPDWIAAQNEMLSASADMTRLETEVRRATEELREARAELMERLASWADSLREASGGTRGAGTQAELRQIDNQYLVLAQLELTDPAATPVIRPTLGISPTDTPRDLRLKVGILERSHRIVLAEIERIEARIATLERIWRSRTSRQNLQSDAGRFGDTQLPVVGAAGLRPPRVETEITDSTVTVQDLPIEEQIRLNQDLLGQLELARVDLAARIKQIQDRIAGSTE